MKTQGLTICACNGHKELTEKMMEEDLPLLKNKQERTALHFACMNGHVEIVLLVLQYARKKGQLEEFVNICDNISHYSALHIACRAGNVEIVKLLVDSRADIHLPVKNGETCVHLACSQTGKEYSEIVELLIEKGAKFLKNEHITNFGKTALHYCAKK